MRRALTLVLLPALLAAPLAWAKTVWIVGKDAPVAASAIAETLAPMLGEETVTLVTNDVAYLSAWANAPGEDATRQAALAADTLLVSLPAAEPDGLALLGLRALAAQRAPTLPAPILVAAQKPVYKMSGLCDDRALQIATRIATAARCGIAPLPKIWQRVYTDDTFYDGRVPKGPRAEAYVFAAGITLAAKGSRADLPALPGVHPEVAADLIASIREGYALLPDVRYAADKWNLPAFPVRVGSAFEAVLYDGAFEHAIGGWLLRLAQADGRALTLHYTTDTDLATGLPCLYRTHTPPAASVTAATLYTRPAFADDTGREELAHLDRILALDAAKPGWIPFPLAVAEFVRRLPDHPVYDGPRPPSPTAAMFAAMLYLKWTGAAVLPPRCDQTETLAITIGLETMLRAKLLRGAVNATICRPLGEGIYAFTLWRRPAGKVTVALSSDDLSGNVEPRTLTFRPETFWQFQTVRAPQGATLYWKVQPALPGQTTGARKGP